MEEKMISNTEAAILGLLSEKPRHPYDIEKTIEERGMREWTEISLSSVYKVLNKLEQKKLVKSKTQISERNQSQKVFHITTAGSKEMVKKVTHLLSQWEKSIWPVDIGISNIHLLNNEEKLQCLEKYKNSVDEAIQCYRELEKYLSKYCSLTQISLAKRPLFLLNGEKKWAKKFHDDVLSCFKEGERT